MFSGYSFLCRSFGHSSINRCVVLIFFIDCIDSIDQNTVTATYSFAGTITAKYIMLMQLQQIPTLSKVSSTNSNSSCPWLYLRTFHH